MRGACARAAGAALAWGVRHAAGASPHPSAEQHVLQASLPAAMAGLAEVFVW